MVQPELVDCICLSGIAEVEKEDKVKNGYFLNSGQYRWRLQELRCFWAWCVKRCVCRESQSQQSLSRGSQNLSCPCTESLAKFSCVSGHLVSWFKLHVSRFYSLIKCIVSVEFLCSLSLLGRSYTYGSSDRSGSPLLLCMLVSEFIMYSISLP